METNKGVMVLREVAAFVVGVKPLIENAREVKNKWNILKKIEEKKEEKESEINRLTSEHLVGQIGLMTT